MKYSQSEPGKARRLAYQRSAAGKEKLKAQYARYKASGKFDFTEYERKPEVKARRHLRNATPKRRQYMAQYQQLSDQKALRAIAGRERKQHISNLATPLWARKKKIAEIYEEAAHKTTASGVPHVVDHVIPLKHPLVCGLHVEFNWQVLTEKENAQKSNKLLTE